MIRSELDVLLDRVDDPALRQDLRIVDPHGDFLADARAKLQALAAFAERFVRIESVARVGDGSLLVLDLAYPAVRTAVLGYGGAAVTALYESEHARPYP